MEASRKTAIEEFVYLGKEYYFCAGICKKAFETEKEYVLIQIKTYRRVLVDDVVCEPIVCITIGS